MNKLTIGLDMDGVITSFLIPAFNAAGVDTNIPAVRRVLKNNSLSTSQTDNELSKICGFKVDLNTLLANKTSEFWESLPITQYANEICNLCNSYGKIIIISNPGPWPQCLQGKVMWLKKLGINDYVLTKHKYLLARNVDLLIDDTLHNFIKWESNGGKALLWPRDISFIDNEANIEVYLSVLNQRLSSIRNLKFFNREVE